MGLNSTNETVKKCVFFVRAKMKNGEYENVEQMEYDLNTMFENAKRYNMPNSSIYKRAFRLQQIMQVNRHVSNLLCGSSADPLGPTGPPLNTLI